MRVFLMRCPNSCVTLSGCAFISPGFTAGGVNARAFLYCFGSFSVPRAVFSGGGAFVRGCLVSCLFCGARMIAVGKFSVLSCSCCARVLGVCVYGVGLCGEWLVGFL